MAGTIGIMIFIRSPSCHYSEHNNIILGVMNTGALNGVFWGGPATPTVGVNRP